MDFHSGQPNSQSFTQRYARQTVLQEIGLQGERLLGSSRVLCIGAGGLGSPALVYLAAAGVGSIGIIDNDAVSLSNLQRQVLYDTIDLGKNKAEQARLKLLSLNPK